MKNLGLFAAVLSLVFLAACGGGGPANPGPPAAGFTNASFSGSYVFTMTGQCAAVCPTASPTQSVGYMVADGNGNITSGSWDVNTGGGDQTVAITGTYAVNSNGTVNLSLSDSLNTYSFGMMLTGTNGGYITTADTAWALSGVVEKQSASAIAAQPTGNYVFRASGVNSGNFSLAIAGAMNFGTGAVIADMNNNGSPITLGTGSLSSSGYVATTGRGLLTISSTSALPSMIFVYYVVDANTLELVSDDATNSLQGRAELTGGAVASGNVLLGSFAFMSSGFPVTGEIQISEGGIFTGNGAGSISSGVIDTVFDSQTPEVGSTLTGSGSISTQGGVTRDALTLSPASSTISMKNPVLWMTSSGRGFFVTLDGDRAEAGTVNIQSGGPFTDSGTYAFGQSGWATTAFTGNGDEGLTSITLFKNTGGTVSGYSQLMNLFGSSTSTTGTGTLSFDSTGTIGSLTLNNTGLGGPEDFRFYQYSSSGAFIMEVDPTTVTSGTMTVQTAQ